MALVTNRECDVCGKTKDVEPYVVLIRPADSQESHVELEVDWCPKALERAMALFQRACAPPAKRNAKGVAAEAQPVDPKVCEAIFERLAKLDSKARLEILEGTGVTYLNARRQLPRLLAKMSQRLDACGAGQ